MAIMTSSVLKHLDDKVVHKICSGQIIISLAVAVKELLENSLDAGARSVEIRLKDYGSSMISVIDDGPGVEKCNFQALALKHYTSKINEFSDIYQCDTYGFRGEALSALCSIADVTIITRDKSADCGTLLKFDETGHLREESLHARTVGTTVFVKNIFSRLPVRRNIFLNSLKREFAKALDLIKAYCMVSRGVRILCTNQIGDKNITTLVSSFGGTVKENIECAFGHDQVKTLLELHCIPPDQQLLEEFRLSSEKQANNSVQFEGYISSCAHGEGRPTRDRQFLYVNSRPCEYELVTKLINAVFHQFQKNRYPFFFLNLKLPHGFVDVNCSPDKRQIFLQNEKLVLVHIKASLLELFRKIESSKCLENQSLISFKPSASGISPSQSALAKLNASLSQESQSAETKSVFEKFKSPKTSRTSLRFGNYFKKEVKSFNSDNSLSSAKRPFVADFSEDASPAKTSKIEENESFNKSSLDNTDCGTPSDEKKVVKCKNKQCYNAYREQTTLDVSFEDISCASQEKAENQTEEGNELHEQDKALKKFQVVMNPEQNAQAEEELRQQITKDMFKKMKVIGQWNLGFIIAQMGSDIFVIDQHAADEIYNFETLMKMTVLQNQRLVVPQQLDLSVSEETTIIDYLDIFKKNGFDFNIDFSAEPSRRLTLTSIPISKAWTFGKDDIEELIAILQDCPDVMCRPKRVRAMFASRACRKSVMIGDSLNMCDMRRIVDHLGELDEPWHCPHGRPTMRHLFNMQYIKNNSEDLDTIMNP